MPAKNVFDPIAILGCSPDEARLLMRGRVVTPGEVEAVATQHYNWRRHLQDDTSYWVVTSQAAQILHLSARQVESMLLHRRLRYVTGPRGVRLMRRHDVEGLAARLLDGS